MRKYNCFSWLKLVFCFLFLTTTVVVFGMRIVDEPVATTVASQDFYMEPCNSSGNLFFCMERLTPESARWWQKKLAYDLYFHFKIQHLDNTPLLTFNLIAAVSDATKICLQFIPEMEANGEFMRSVMERVNCVPEEKRKRMESAASFSPDLTEGARAFHYNVAPETGDYTGIRGSTWVAYVSSRPEPYSRDPSKVTSPEIKIAVTVKISDHFYSPLGIYRSSIAHAFDKKAGAVTGHLAMPLQSFIARTVSIIKPSAMFLVFRPREPMMKLIREKGIHYSMSNNGQRQQQGALPYLCFDGGGNSPNPANSFRLVDQSSDTTYTISPSHWFCTSPYIGGARSASSYMGCPFIVINRMELAHLLPIVAVPRCALCGKTNADLPSDHPLLQCARCHNALYCSPECQRSHWKAHKPNCNPK